MAVKRLLTIFTIFVFLEYAVTAPTDRPTIAEVQENLDTVARVETEKFLNNLFTAQIEYFEKVRAKLSPTTERAKDIQLYVQRLREAVEKKTLTDKDQMWMDTFNKFHKSPLLLNKVAETGLTDAEYEKIVADSGLSDLVKNCLADLAAYFWKMARASGKVMEVTVDEYLEKLKTNVPSGINFLP